MSNMQNTSSNNQNLNADRDIKSLSSDIQDLSSYINNLSSNILNLGSNIQNISLRETQLIAHRGLNSVANEQSELSYIKAYENGITSWECDVQNTSDGELVLVHDLTLARTSKNDSRTVSNITYAQISTVDNSKLIPYYSPTYILTFDQFIKIAKRYPEVIIYPEISPYQSSAAKVKTVETIINHGMENRTIIQSFNFNDFAVVRERSTNMKIGYLTSNLTTFNQALTLAAADGNAEILADYTILLNNPNLVTQCIQNGVGLAVWTVNDNRIYKQLRDIGINRIMTDSLIGGYI